jgi:hypothetical protein
MAKRRIAVLLKLELKFDLLSFTGIPIWPAKLRDPTMKIRRNPSRPFTERDERKITYLGMNLPYGGPLSTIFA